MPILEREPSVFPCDLLTDAAVATTEDPSLKTDRQWWAVYTRSRQEKALARQLYQLQIPFYLPLVPMCHLYQGRKMSSYLPLFQGYVFLFGNEEERLISLTTKRITCILPVKDQTRLCEDLFNV
jgi:transcriptional antiterminator RfaH